MDQFQSILPVLLGGLLALSGGVVTQLITHYLVKKREFETLHRQKGEALVKALYCHMQWMEEKLDTMVMELKKHNSSSPLDEARMLQRLYFPELETEVKEILKTCSLLIKFIHDQRIARLTNETEWLSKKTCFIDKYHSLSMEMNFVTEVATEKCRQVLYKRKDN